MGRKADWIIATAGVLMLALACCNATLGQTVPRYGGPNPVFRQDQTTGDATAQQNITIPSPFNFTVQPGASITFGAGTIGLGSLATIPNGDILGNSSGSPASPSAQAVGGGLSLSAGALGIAANGVTNSLLAQSPANTIKGNNTGAPANAADLTVSQVNALTGNYNGAALTATPANPTATTSTTFVMMGLGSACALTPAISTRVLVTFDGSIFNSTASTNSQVELQTGTGTAPANGAAITGTTHGAAVTATSESVNGQRAFSLTRMLTGLTPGQAIWADLALKTVTAGTANVQVLTCTLTEQ